MDEFNLTIHHTEQINANNFYGIFFPSDSTKNIKGKNLIRVNERGMCCNNIKKKVGVIQC